MFKYQTQISFDQCDPAGIIFYGRAFELAHRAFERLVVNVGIQWDDWFASETFAVPIVHAEVDCQSPLRPGHQVEVQAMIDKIGNSSITFSYRIVRDGALCATMKTVHVFMGKETKTKMQIPDAIKSLVVGAMHASP